MGIKIRKATDIEPKYLSWMIYGRPGSGKTTLIGTFPPPIFIIGFASERGITTLRGHPGVEYAEVTTRSEMNDAMMYVLANPEKYKTVAVDSTSTFQELLFAEQSAKGPVKQAHWLMWRTEILSMAARLAPLPFEKVYTALLAQIADESGVGTRGGPALFKSLAEQLPAKMDNLIYVECETDGRGTPTYRAYPSGKGSIPGRMRGARPGQSIANPSYRALFDLMKSPLFGGAQPDEPEQPELPPEPVEEVSASEAAAKVGM